MRTLKEKCGCRYRADREAWVELCPAHEAEFQETHQRWAREKREADARQAGEAKHERH